MAKDFQVLVVLGQGVDQAKGQQMRQVAGRGQNLVVLIDAHHFDASTHRLPQITDPSGRLWVGTGQWR